MASQKTHKKIKKDIESSFTFFNENIKNHKKNMRFSFKETITDMERSRLSVVNKPDIEVNYVQAYLSRFLGEFKMLSPSVAVRGNGSGDEVNVKQVEIVQGHIQFIIEQFQKSGISMDVFRELTGGGYSVLKVLTKYRKEKFEQDIYLSKADDPLTCFFDPMAKLLSKEDGKFCGEVYPMSKTEFKKKYPKYADKADTMRYVNIGQASDFSWAFKSKRKQMVMLVEYYCVEEMQYDLLLLSDGSTLSRSDYNQYMKEYEALSSEFKVQPPLEVIKSRKEKKNIIKRYVLFGEDIIEEEKTSLPGLPYIFVSSQNIFVYKSSSSDEIQQVTRSYLESAMDAQRLFNFLCQTLANYAENYMNQKFIVDERAVVDEESWTDPQTASVLLKRSIDDNGEVIHEAVKEVVQQDLPPAIVGAFTHMQNTIQNTLGTYDAQMGINQKELSGKALIAGATQNNVIGVPFMGGFACALTAACELILKMIPQYYVTAMTVPYVDDSGDMTYVRVNDDNTEAVSFNYKPSEFDIEIKSSPSFAIQKDQALNMMSKLSQSFPAFGEFINQVGLPFILENLDIKGIDKLVQMAKEMQKAAQMQNQQQQQQPNPEQQAIILKQQELQLKAQEAQEEAQIKREELQIRKVESANQVFMEQLKLKRELINDAARYKTHAVDDAAKIAEAEMKKTEQEHQHAMDLLHLSNTAVGE